MGNTLNWEQSALRLFLTALAAALIGFERERDSRAAGLRTTLLVAFAACLAMLQADALLGLRGKAADSYIVMDLMRLPLGILSGMGFIGAGAILRKDDMVMGVTTAATLWFVTVMGLCFGGGQLGLGVTAAFLGLAVLKCLKWFEVRWQHDQRATLCLILDAAGPGEEAISRVLNENGCRASHWSASYSREDQKRTLSCDVHWRGIPTEPRLPGFLGDLAQLAGVLELKWQREGGMKQS